MTKLVTKKPKQKEGGKIKKLKQKPAVGTKLSKKKSKSANITAADEPDLQEETEPAPTNAADSEPVPTSVPVAAAAAESCKIDIETDEEHDPNDQNGSGKRRQKLIAFIGNLPYGMTEERLRDFLNMNEHIIEIRLPRSHTNKSRTQGYAFCEFNDKLAFRKCLLLHHTKLEGRRINVELTAGGGGNTAHRKKKIADKNRAADKWRAKRVQKKEQEQRSDDRKQGEKKKSTPKPASS